MDEISIDCETLSTAPDARILSIGAVRFNRETGEMGPEFYRLLELRDDTDGGHISPSTVQWWGQQSAQAQADVFGKNLERVRLLDALTDLKRFCAHGSVYWQRGNIDSVWLDSAYDRVGLGRSEAPWGFWQWRDQRTLTEEFGHLIDKAPRKTAHNALDDARAQAADIIAVYAALGLLGVV